MAVGGEFDHAFFPSGVDQTFTIWPQKDFHRIVGFLQVSSIAAIAAVCKAMKKHTEMKMDKTQARPNNLQFLQENLEAEEILRNLSWLSDEAKEKCGPLESETCLLQQLSRKQEENKTVQAYVYIIDWEIKPGALFAKKGTWLKTSTRFSWELGVEDKLYVPTGLGVPILQVAKITDEVELKRHDWAANHMRVWVKPGIINKLRARRDVWFVYIPHFHEQDDVVVAVQDTWLKRTTQLSGEMDSFELVYVPKGLPIFLTKHPEPVGEPWEVKRHAHVHFHRTLHLDGRPLTTSIQDSQAEGTTRYEIFIGQEGRPLLFDDREF